ncbi:MAG: hypothetical protein IT270_01425 [Saprospiraceae bacterium]|nr:hypothetical protein [Saprospiraceae bacterium]
MKKLLFACLLFSALASCNQDAESTAKPETTKPITVTVPSRSCYLYTTNGDTFSLKLTIADAKVMGTLNYNFAQKDDNTGFLEGSNVNKVIVADYTFTSEGQKSVREVAFQRVGNDYVEGFGEMTELNGKMVFKDRNAIKFEEKMVYKSVSCR